MVTMIVAIVVRSWYEWRVSQTNYVWWIERGGLEAGHGGHRARAALQLAWLFGMVVEFVTCGRTVSPFWPALAAIVALSWGVRSWIVVGGRKHWTMRMLLRPTDRSEPSRTHRWTSDPFALAAIIEGVATPLLFSAYLTAITASTAYCLAWWMRIRERADRLQRPSTRSTSRRHTNRIDTPT